MEQRNLGKFISKLRKWFNGDFKTPLINEYNIENNGTPKIIPTIPNKPPKINKENNTQKLLNPVLLPNILGPIILPSICCNTKINIIHSKLHFSKSTLLYFT